ncbi:late embryogenesis abundant protein At3g53040-like [Salvia splendens]|uniref:late embryogenesis abundant protein At3g53040-like n=1 Tax=Salvia splendens TaxID=180675 RepID=UPI001C259E3E|nr:late embryogenesis abundant protein At3g53040-like [Salvia splendens]
MAALKNVFLSLSKSSELSQSLPLRPTVSRVYFAAASRHQQVLLHSHSSFIKSFPPSPTHAKPRLKGRNMAGSREYSPYNDEEPQDEVRETMDKAKEKTREMKDRAKETADSVKERAQQMNDKTKENLGSMADRAYEMREKTADKTKRQAHEATDKVKGAAETAADKTKGYAQGAKETTKGAAEKVADAAKETTQKIKETTQKIKETVVGKSDDDDLDDYIEEHVKKPAREHRGEKVMDEDVVDARRRRADEHDRGKL